MVIYPHGYVKIAIENDHRNSEFPDTHRFSMVMSNYQRVTQNIGNGLEHIGNGQWQ